MKLPKSLHAKREQFPGCDDLQLGIFEIIDAQVELGNLLRGLLEMYRMLKEKHNLALYLDKENPEETSTHACSEIPPPNEMVDLAAETKAATQAAQKRQEEKAWQTIDVRRRGFKALPVVDPSQPQSPS